VTDTNSSIEISKRPLDEFVEMDSSEIIVAEQRVLSEHSLNSEGFGSHHNDMRENAGALMAMDDIDLFSNEDLSDEWETVEE
jgi:hypothetical protein